MLLFLTCQSVPHVPVATRYDCHHRSFDQAHYSTLSHTDRCKSIHASFPLPINSPESTFIPRDTSYSHGTTIILPPPPRWRKRRVRHVRDGDLQEMVEDQFHAFCFLTRASRLVMAQSTFSWWVAFLGNATEIHFPLANRGVTGPKVAVDEQRYVYRDESGRVVPPP